jgi:hypothetical protein
MYRLYLITNTLNGRRYVGKSHQTLEERWANHLQAVEKGSHFYVHNAIRKYTPLAFTIEEIETFSDEEELSTAETAAIWDYRTHWTKGGYNLNWGPDEGPKGPIL